MKPIKVHLLPCLILLAAASTAGAALVFEQTEIEKTASLFDERMEVAFGFVNEGGEPVTITELRSSCGCTVPQLEKKTYEPGEKGEVKALFNFGSRKGKQRKSVTVLTNDGAVQRLTFTTNIPVWGDVSPSILRWRVGEDPAPREVRMRIEDPDTISVKDTAPEVGGFTLETVRAGPGEWIFKVTPHSTEQRVTRRVAFVLEAGDGDSAGTRQLAFHCLVR